MTVLTVLVVLVVAVVALFVGLQAFLVLRVRRQRGRPAPDLPGRPGRAVKDGSPALFYFFSPTCGPCRAMTPVVKALPGQDRAVFAVDITRDMDTARRFGVMATPTTVLVQGGVVREILVGPQTETVLRGLLARA